MAHLRRWAKMKNTIIISLLLFLSACFPHSIDPREEAGNYGDFGAPLMLFRVHYDRYPSSDEGLEALRHPPAPADGKWRGPYIDSDFSLNDKWGRPLQYENAEGRIKIWSLGSDGISSADDITLYQK